MGWSSPITFSSGNVCVGGYFLSAGGKIPKGFESLRQAIGDLNDAPGLDELRERHDEIYVELDRVLEQARADLAR